MATARFGGRMAQSDLRGECEQVGGDGLATCVGRGTSKTDLNNGRNTRIRDNQFVSWVHVEHPSRLSSPVKRRPVTAVGDARYRAAADEHANRAITRVDHAPRRRIRLYRKSRRAGKESSTRPAVRPSDVLARGTTSIIPASILVRSPAQISRSTSTFVFNASLGPETIEWV